MCYIGAVSYISCSLAIMYTNTIPASWLEHVCLYIDYLTNLISSLHLQLLKQLLNRLQIKAHSLSTAIHKENNKFANIHKYSQDIFAELVTCSCYNLFSNVSRQSFGSHSSLSCDSCGSKSFCCLRSELVLPGAWVERERE